MALNTGGTKTVTAEVLDSTGTTVLGTVTATDTFVDGPNCGFVTGISDDGTPQYVTRYSGFTVNATGSTGYVPVPIAVSYVYTFVNDLGWESAPSPASDTVTRPDGVSVVVTMATTYPEDSAYAVTTKNLYRAVTGATGTVFKLVASGIPLATATYNDVLDDSELGKDVLLSDDWDLPNPDMEGIIALPNGIMAGFFKNQLCLSAQGAPWAWPVAFRLPTDTDIVAIANIDNTIVIGTKSFVYTATGNSPDSFSMSKPGEAQSCASKRSMTYVDGFGVVFSSPDGFQVCAGSAGNVRNATSSIFNKRQWQALDPTSILSAVHDGVLHFFYDAGATQGGYALDTSSDGFGLIQLSYHATAAHVDPVTDTLYLSLSEINEPTDAALPSPPSFALEQLPFDPDFANVGYLVRANGVGAPSTFVDEAGGTWGYTSGGVSQLSISATQSKWGGGALASRHSASTVGQIGKTLGSPIVLPATNAHAIEGWVFPAGFGSNQSTYIGRIATTADSSAFAVWFSPFFGLRYQLSLSSLVFLDVGPPAFGVWSHIAGTYDGTTARLWVNGVLVASAVVTPGAAQTVTGFVLGELTGSDWGGYEYLDDLRGTLNIPRYVAPFTPPAAQFGNTSVSPGPVPSVYAFDSDPAADLTYRWKGKLNLMPHPSTMHFAKVEAGDFANILARVRRDGTQIDKRAIANADSYRIEGKQPGNTYELELLGTSTVRTMQTAQTVEELD